MRAFVFAIVISCASIAAAASLYVGVNGDVDYTAEALDTAAAGVQPKRCAQLTIRATAANTANVYIGGSGVAVSTGHELTVTNPAVTLTGGISLATVYAIAGTSNQSLSFVCVY